MQSDPVEARQDFQHALALDPEYTLAEEYIATIDGRVEDAHRRLAFAQTTGLDRDVMERVGEHLGRGDDQVGGSFWGDVWNVTKDVGEAGLMVAAGTLTGGLADAAIGGTIGVLGEAGAEALGFGAEAVTNTVGKATSGSLDRCI